MASDETDQQQFPISTQHLLILLLFAPFLLIYLIRLRFRTIRHSGTFAFFHPYCDAGGGGERVLWRAVNILHQRFPNLKIVIYTGDVDRTPEQILEKAKTRFGITVSADRLQFVYLQNRWLLEAKNYPRFTLFGQMVGGLAIGIEALCRHPPEWFMDTTGCPMTLPVFRWLGDATTMAYVHYPIITTEMIQLVDSRRATYNNSDLIASSSFLSNSKLLYYRAIAFLYRCCGRCCQLTMANGSWTGSHLADLWACKPLIVFPPCDVERLSQLESRSEQLFEEATKADEKNHAEKRQATATILSIGQIRPEKNHLKQLRIFADLLHRLVKKGSNIDVKLVIAGGCRDQEDQKRVEFLQNYARGNFKMETGREVDWELNVPIEKLIEIMKNSLIGLHTMENEHFGISVVEHMAAGQIVIAHNSGGPKLDIIGGESTNGIGNEGSEDIPCGFLANTLEEYVATIMHILEMEPAHRERIRQAARQKAQRFSQQRFDEEFCSAIERQITMDIPE